MLSKSHIQAINSARKALKRLEEETSNKGYPQGKFAEACKSAQSALLNVLIIAHHWLGDKVSDEEMHGQ